ncbi:phosphoribosylformylglycinamidine synthase subunit PurS [Candidatus Poriferisocius sp.]|uniref:phosphoribosylformylglycinamidine synthase subunit PurS n=1 Tax=Candidatus Poriferisocius sp. TaxID=3101276 RepID=UPI00138601BB|nr:phosphoribosylformylglycinamidine synthase subunit PurS [Acidimicrobiia bacterium]MYE72689.1 phosphoribosylformylglycinamidine synthase subunit PurS [Acidimicrobiia bacterium]MYJ61566.1 phosphoribosylformylglycinamidine synthase subunit PurS [Acidimicrobiia bacterium]
MSTEFNVIVEVSLREGIADPEGLTIERALPALGFNGVSDIRVGKSLRFVVEASDEPEARSQVESMCERFLANPVIEDVNITLGPSA